VQETSAMSLVIMENLNENYIEAKGKLYHDIAEIALSVKRTRTQSLVNYTGIVHTAASKKVHLKTKRSNSTP